MRESTFMNEMRAEGAVKARQEALLQVLRLRFPKKLPTELMSAVKAQRDAAKLTAWLDVAVTAATPEEFQAALGQ